MVAGQLARHSHIPTRTRQQFAAASSSVLDRMKPPAALRFIQNVESITFYRTVHQLNRELSTRLQTIREGNAKGQFAPGLYEIRGGRGFLHLNGVRGTTVTLREMFAHEFIHAVNGPKRELSESPEWQEAWKHDIVPKQSLTEQARRLPHEAMSELGGYWLSGQIDDSTMQSDFPMCLEYLQRFFT
jgi:hypothetical protein